MALLPYGSPPGKTSVIQSGTTDGVNTGLLKLFFNTDQLALKVFYQGVWITIAAVSFDSLWDSQTDVWNSASMDWNAPS